MKNTKTDKTDSRTTSHEILLKLSLIFWPLVILINIVDKGLKNSGLIIIFVFLEHGFNSLSLLKAWYNNPRKFIKITIYWKEFNINNI